MNLVTWVPVDFQQKTNTTFNDKLDPKNILVLSDRTRYAKWCRFCVVFNSL